MASEILKIHKNLLSKKISCADLIKKKIAELKKSIHKRMHRFQIGMFGFKNPPLNHRKRKKKTDTITEFFVHKTRRFQQFVDFACRIPAGCIAPFIMTAS